MKTILNLLSLAMLPLLSACGVTQELKEGVSFANLNRIYVEMPSNSMQNMSYYMNPAEITLQEALALLDLPRTIGVHPETNQEIQAGIGRFGPYLKIGSTFKSLTAADNVLTITLPRALEVLSTVKEKTPPQEIGAHPADGKPIVASSGRFGPYIKHGSMIASIPKAIRDENRLPTLQEAIALLAAKAEKKPKAAAKKTAKATTKTKTKKKTTKAKAKKE